MKTIKLTEPIMIEGKSVSELKFDTKVMSVDIENEAYKKLFVETLGQHGLVENCFPYHRIIGMMIAAESNNCEYEDLSRLCYADIKVLASEGRDFLLKPGSSDTPNSTETETEHTGELVRAKKEETAESQKDLGLS